MYLALYALLTVVGVAIAWRSNPMYSTGRTVRFLALMALALAAFVGVVIAVVDAGERMSTTGAAVLLAVTILLGTIFLIWVTVTASTPPVPKIGAGTRLLSVNRAHVTPWLPRLFIGLAVFALVAFFLQGDARDGFLIIGGLFAGLAIVLVFTLYIAALGMDRSLTSVEAAAWIHWRYTPEAWSAWRETLVARSATKPRSWTWRRDWKRFVAPFFMIAVVVVALNAASVPLAWSLSCVAISAMFVAILVEAAARSEAAAPDRLRRLLLSAPPETYAGDAGIFCDGVYLQWETTSNWLASATIDARAPRSIDFEFVQIVVGASSPRHIRQSVLIPPDTDDDLRTLQTQLAARFPTATIALTG